MKYFLTTPIYYVNAAPHIGHTYTTIAADAIKRLKTMQGYDVTLVTGTDEHGQKIERAAAAANKSPQEFTDVVSAEFRKQWKDLDLLIDRFQRTTDSGHAKVVQDFFEEVPEERLRIQEHLHGSVLRVMRAVRYRCETRRSLPGLRAPD